MRISKLNKIIASFLTLFACFSIGYGSWNIHAEKSYSVGEKGDKPIAYFEKTEDKKIVKHYFTTIEAACETAGKDDSSNTIYVIPRTDPTIEKPCTLYSGDTLMLSMYDAVAADKDGGKNRDADTNDVDNSRFADYDPNTFRKNQIILKKKLTIESGATLVVAGENGGASPQGATSGNYCELVIDNGGSIECNGTINCYGYIKDMSETKDNSEDATITVNNGGQIFEPLAIYDWGSGKNALARKKEGMFPFNVFDLPNIRSKMKFSYGGSLNCYIHTYGTTLGHQHAGSAIIVGKAEETAFIQMSSSTSLFWNFDSTEISKTGDSAVDHTAYVDIDGDFSLGKLTVSLNGVSVDSSEFYLPMPHIYKLTHNNGEANLNYKTKFLPGSSLKIGKNSTVNMNNNVLFYETNKVTENQTIYNYYVNTPAVLINDGTLNINAGFSGFIDTTSETGIINVGGEYSKPTDSYEAYDFKFLGVQKTGPFATDGGTINYSEDINGDSLKQNEPISKTRYLSKGAFWLANYLINLVAKNGDTTSDGNAAKRFTAVATLKLFGSSNLENAPNANWSLTSGYSDMSSTIDKSNIQNGIILYSVSFTLPKYKGLLINPGSKQYYLCLSLNIDGIAVSSNTLEYVVHYKYGI